MTIAIWPLLFAVAGGVIYLACSQQHQKTGEIGRLLCAVGLLWFVYGTIARTLQL